MFKKFLTGCFWLFIGGPLLTLLLIVLYRVMPWWAFATMGMIATAGLGLYFGLKKKAEVLGIIFLVIAVLFFFSLIPTMWTAANGSGAISSFIAPAPAATVIPVEVVPSQEVQLQQAEILPTDPSVEGPKPPATAVETLVYPGVMRYPKGNDTGWLIGVGPIVNTSSECDTIGDNHERQGCDLEVWKYYTNEVYTDVGSSAGVAWFSSFEEAAQVLSAYGTQEVRLLFSESCRVDPMRPGECRVKVENLHLLDAELSKSDGVMLFNWDVNPDLYIPWPPQP